MKSIKTKFIILMLVGLLLSCGFIGVVGIYYTKTASDRDSNRIMNLLCDQKAQQINALLSRIEQSVKTLSVYAVNQVTDINKFINNSDFIKQCAKAIQPVAINAASNTEGALAVYVRYNPAFAGPTSGLFAVNAPNTNFFEVLPPTNLSIYGPKDEGFSDWYYKPLENKSAMWIEPYYNKNIDIEMISYVIPIELDGVILGVVGMDIDFNVIKDIVDGTEIYSSGYAFLVNQHSEIIHHIDLENDTPLSSVSNGELSGLVEYLKNKPYVEELFDYTYKGIDKKLAYQTLDNNMNFVLTAPTQEIKAEQSKLIYQIIIITFVIGIVLLLLTFVVTKRIIKPLQELTIAAKKVAKGDLNVNIIHNSNDEIGELSNSFRETINHLQKYIDCINELAYKDALTGVKNKTAYLEYIDKLNYLVKLTRPEFAVAVFDINNLKLVNDSYGHDFGDMLIIDACKLICRTFKRSPVYRIGGDEFVCILEKSDFENYLDLLDEFKLEVIKYNKNPTNGITITIAKGLAVYNFQSDINYHDVFKRADDAMYYNKSAMKNKEN